MPKKAEFLECSGRNTPDRVFLLEYQRAVLFSLQKEGLLDQIQLEECLKKLKSQCP